MLQKAAPLPALALLAGLAAGCGGARQPEASSQVQPPPSVLLPAASAPAAPDFNLEVVSDASRLELSGLCGKKVVINFWATWCEPCREEFPELIEFDRRHRGGGVTFLSISLDSPKERDAKVKEFLAAQRPAFPVFIKTAGDPDAFINAIDPAWSGELPATFIYDRSGQRRQALFGQQTLRSLENYIQPLL